MKALYIILLIGFVSIGMVYAKGNISPPEQIYQYISGDTLRHTFNYDSVGKYPSSIKKQRMD
jgi:hypothetical protein